MSNQIELVGRFLAMAISYKIVNAAIYLAFLFLFVGAMNLDLNGNEEIVLFCVSLPTSLYVWSFAYLLLKEKYYDK